VALSPSIPTSFVPKQPVSPGNKRYSAGTNVLLIISLVVLGIAVFISAGVFLYSAYLASVEKTKGDELVSAQNSVSADTLTQFIRLRDRLNASKTILSQHVMLSQFFSLLENITVQNVHFSSLQVTVAADRSAQISMLGEARSFNALAAESSTFAAQKNIKSAIFSGIAVDSKTGTVTFTVNAALAPGLVVESAAPAVPALLPGTATATSTTPSFQSTATVAPSAQSTSTATTTKKP
jgi:hypothetical protein